MLEFIGITVWILFTIGLSVLPFLLIGISGLGGGLDYKDKLFILTLLSIACYSWYNLFESISITIN